MHAWRMNFSVNVQCSSLRERTSSRFLDTQIVSWKVNTLLLHVTNSVWNCDGWDWLRTDFFTSRPPHLLAQFDHEMLTLSIFQIVSSISHFVISFPSKLLSLSSFLTYEDSHLAAHTGPHPHSPLYANHSNPNTHTLTVHHINTLTHMLTGLPSQISSYIHTAWYT